jgi:hypothetical protein
MRAMHVSEFSESVSQRVDALFHPTTQAICIEAQEL